MAKLKLAALAPMIEQQVRGYDTHFNRDVYLSRKIPNADMVRDINKRFRWDILWAISRDVRQSFFDKSKELGGNDSHIDSLLKSLVPDLEKETV